MKKIILALLLLLPIGHAHSQQTLSDLITQARTLALDSASNPSLRFTDAQITAFINQAQRNLVTQGHCIWQNTIFELELGTTYYSLPSNFVTIERVTVGRKNIPQMTSAALDARSRGWEVASGYPVYYFVNFSSRGLIGFSPWPAQSTDTDTVKVEYTVHATDLSSSVDVPFNGINELQPYGSMLAYYAAGMMNLINGQSAQATAIMQVYAGQVETFNKMCLDLPGYRPGGIGQP